MDETDLDQNFDTITMAILHGYPLGAREVFKISIQKTVNNKMDEAIKIIEKNGAFYLIDAIQKLKLGDVQGCTNTTGQEAQE